MFTPQEIIRYSKQIQLDDIGPAGQLKLKQAKVLVIGAGGLGCPVLQYMNAIGVGTLGIADFDTIAADNLHRQILYGPQDTGKKKAVVAMERLAIQNPFTTLQLHDVAVTEENALSLFAGYDIVIDACDNFPTRYAVNDACVVLGIPLVYGSILGYQAQIAVFNYKGSKNLRDVFPLPPNPEDVPDCSENGVLGTVPGIVGCIMAQAVTGIIMGRPSYVNQLLLLNTQTMQQNTLVL